VKKINIDMSQFELSKDDIKQMRSIDKKTLSSPNYKKNKRVNLEYYAEDELEDVGTDDYSDCDGREELETLGDAGMDIY
jgi:hypothetical protein|tara:strand:+ start:1587 stop:1823 length:237 start_codon:yes stop_codon:yes gene_type:complete